jgi:aromatic ring-cleaving dioxygenase
MSEATINGWHAHVYYDADSRPGAAALRDKVIATLPVECRDLADAPRGPHPVPQFRFSFTAAQFADIVPWLMLNRGGLDVLVHPLTKNSHADHSDYAIWLGAPKPLRLSGMRGEYRPDQLPAAAK